MELKREDLKNGEALTALIENYWKETTESSLAAVFSCIRDSIFIVPHYAVNSEGIICEGAGAGEDDVLIPDILENEGYSFFPVFSSEEKILADYGSKVKKVEMHFLEIVDMAKDMTDVAGIVIVAFSAPYILEKELSDVVASLPSKIKED
jgi:hypothetical protein